MSLLDFYIFVVDSRDVNFFQSTTSYHSCGFGFFFFIFFLPEGSASTAVSS